MCELDKKDNLFFYKKMKFILLGNLDNGEQLFLSFNGISYYQFSKFFLFFAKLWPSFMIYNLIILIYRTTGPVPLPDKSLMLSPP